MHHLTKEQVLKRARKTTTGSMYDSAASMESYSRQKLNEQTIQFSEARRYDVFLSHSYQDAQTVLGAKGVLEDQGLSVYVDWIEDRQLNREKVNKDTANTLRKRMNQCKSFLYLATKNSVNSKWMPWEIGYFDGKRSNKIAILPILNSETENFEGQEYLSLYPIIKNLTRLYVSDTALFESLEAWINK